MKIDNGCLPSFRDDNLSPYPLGASPPNLENGDNGLASFLLVFKFEECYY